MENLDLLIDLHIDGHRQGPGGTNETCMAVILSGLEKRTGLKIADIGCGTGASTVTLARTLDAEITAVDFLPEFLTRLDNAAEQEGLSGQITTLAASMEALPFEDSTFDAIWSEGAIYNMGFEEGISAWRQFLKPGGILAVSELSWFTQERPEDLEAHWNNEYPGVAVASAKLAILEANGYSPLGYFPLPKHCWIDNYYRPLQERFASFLSRNAHSDAARAIVAAEEKEIAFYERYATYFGYGYYIARRLPD